MVEGILKYAPDDQRLASACSARRDMVCEILILTEERHSMTEIEGMTVSASFLWILVFRVNEINRM